MTHETSAPVNEDQIVSTYDKSLQNQLIERNLRWVGHIVRKENRDLSRQIDSIFTGS